MDELYKRYGALMIQLEILQGQIQECKQRIAAELNKPKVEPKPCSEPSSPALE